VLLQWIQSLPRGQVRTLVAEDVTEALATLELESAAHPLGQVIVSRRWDSVPGVETLTSDLVTTLAQAALAAWPDRSEPVAVGPGGGQGDNRPSPTWLVQAVALVRAGRLPLPAGFAPAVQAEQLAAVLGTSRLVVVLALAAGEAEPSHLLGATSAAEWVARATGAAVAVLVGRVLAGTPALERILYDALWLPGAVAARRGVREAPEENRGWLWPLYGYPHPGSPGERLLAGRLGGDAELAGLFGFNQVVETVKDTRYVVDLLWPSGRLVVEVDGYRYHASREAFTVDRQRDFELLVSGYLVLRLAHDEVLSNPDRALDKIREVVRYRAAKPSQEAP